jgi:peptidoglycan LD-endopeptidase LytH
MLKTLLVTGLMILLLVLVVYALSKPAFNIDSSKRTVQVLAWLNDPASYPEWRIQSGQRCGNAPFILPTDGFVGYLWNDSFQIGHRHQGIDIFGGTEVNVTPVIAAYPGYLTRQTDWKSSVIIRIPDDPLQPGRQIWVYYTHMASPDGESYISAAYPPGISEIFVEAGTLLGYQGNYSGTPGNPTGVHLHISIVKDNGQGGYLNELEIDNTLDPSPYLGLPLNAQTNSDVIPVCQS